MSSLLSKVFKFLMIHIIAIQMPLIGTIIDLSSYICFAPLGPFVLKYKMIIKHAISYDENIVRRASCFVPVSESWALEVDFVLPHPTFYSYPLSWVKTAVLWENVTLCNRLLSCTKTQLNLWKRGKHNSSVQ